MPLQMAASTRAISRTASTDVVGKGQRRRGLTQHAHELRSLQASGGEQKDAVSSRHRFGTQRTSGTIPTNRRRGRRDRRPSVSLYRETFRLTTEDPQRSAASAFLDRLRELPAD